MKLQSATAVILLAILFTSSIIESTITTPLAGPPDHIPIRRRSIECNKKCQSRCAAGYGCGFGWWCDGCLKRCGICCEKCKCVECPCYRSMKNAWGNNMCP